MVRPALLALLAACNFRTHEGPDAELSNGSDAAIRDAADAAVDSAGACGGKLWIADFSTDPSQLDVNGDGVKDWALRDGSTFPTSQLSGGVWHVPSAGLPPLDTQPKQPFTTRTLVQARMRGTASNGARGAVFWINVGYQADNSFAPLFVDAKLEVDNTLTLHVLTKTAAGLEQELAQHSGLPNDFVDFSIDIDPSTLRATFAGGGIAGTYQLVQQAAGTATDQWATLTAYSTAAEFDAIRVEVCP